MTEGDSHALMRRLREREGEAAQLKVQIGDLQARRDALKQEILSAGTVAETYAPRLIDEAKRLGAREELRGLLRMVVDVVEWRQDAADSKKGEALIQLFPLPGGFLAKFGVQQRDGGFVTLSHMAPTTGLEPVPMVAPGQPGVTNRNNLTVVKVIGTPVVNTDQPLSITGCTKLGAAVDVSLLLDLECALRRFDETASVGDLVEAARALLNAEHRAGAAARFGHASETDPT